MRRCYKIDWDDDWILSNINNYPTISILLKAYNESHETDHIYRSFSNHIKRTFDMVSPASFTKKHEKWLKDNLKTFSTYADATNKFNAQFNQKRTEKAIHAKMKRLNLYIDVRTLQDNWSYPRRVPIGTIKDDGDGYLKIKVGKEYSSSGWVRYHRWVYEQNYGKLPRGYKILFLDNNKQNYDPSNMIAVPASYFALMNKLNLRSEFPEVNLAGIKWCELYSVLRKKGWKLSRGEMIFEGG